MLEPVLIQGHPAGGGAHITLTWRTIGFCGCIQGPWGGQMEKQGRHVGTKNRHRSRPRGLDPPAAAFRLACRQGDVYC